MDQHRDDFVEHRLFSVFDLEIESTPEPRALARADMRFAANFRTDTDALVKKETPLSPPLVRGEVI